MKMSTQQINSNELPTSLLFHTFHTYEHEPVAEKISKISQSSYQTTQAAVLKAVKYQILASPCGLYTPKQ